MMNNISFSGNIINLDEYKAVQNSRRRKRRLLNNGSSEFDSVQFSNKNNFEKKLNQITRQTPQLADKCETFKRLLEYDVPRIDIYTGVLMALKTDISNFKKQEEKDGILELTASFLKEDKVFDLFMDSIYSKDYDGVESFLKTLEEIDQKANRIFLRKYPILTDEINRYTKEYENIL